MTGVTQAKRGHAGNTADTAYVGGDVKHGLLY